MFSIPNCRSIGVGLHVLLAIIHVAFGTGIAKSHLPRTSLHANEECVNVGGDRICYFKGSEDIVDWNKAKQFCNSLNSSLPVIRNKDEQNAVAGYLMKHLANSTAWTAGRYFKHSDWTWINGDSQTVSVQGPDCKSVDGTKVTDKCLTFIKDNETWYGARNHCLMNNGDLAVIGDEGHEALKTLRSTLNQRFWIGLRKKSWRWNRTDDAANNDEIKYTNWDDKSASTMAECISITALDGKWMSSACALETSNAVLCQRVVSERTSVDSKSSIPPSLLFASLGAVILIIICIIVIIVFVLRTKRGRRGQSGLNDGYVQTNGEELDTRITNAPVYTSINEPTDASANRSDDMRGVYADIALLTSEQSEDGGTDQQPGTVYVSLDFNKNSTSMEPDKTISNPTFPTKVGPLGDIYAIPGARGHAITSPGDGSTSHPVKVTPQGDVYAIPMKMSTSPTTSPPTGAVYANLRAATLDKEQMAEDNSETK